MATTARGVVDNLLDAVRRFGFVPNGGRLYYLDRTQPPLLADSVLAVYRETGDKDWLAEALPALEAEYRFWMDPRGGRLVQVPQRCVGEGENDIPMVLNIYCSRRKTPRPESYAEDLATAVEGKALGRDPADVYRGLSSGAESGWDFSTRWLEDGAGGAALGSVKLATICSHRIVPVDLNCFLYRVELALATAHEELGAGGSEAACACRTAAAARAKAMDALLWDGDRYRDFRLEGGMHSAVVAVSDWAAPLWAGLHGPEGSEQGGRAMLASLLRSGLIREGGAATTDLDSKGQTQWDAPNAWPPLQHMLVAGLDQLADLPGAKELADRLSDAWLSSCSTSWRESGFMCEKYNADVPGQGGGGGEYEPQVGFGWSNGVVLALLARGANFAAGAQRD